jgi:CRP-like cAMP-binding protein
MKNPMVKKLQNFVPIGSDDRAFLDGVIERKRTVPAKVDIISEGDAPDEVHLILKGFACRYKILKNGSRQIMAYLVPGDLCDVNVFLLDHMDHSLGALSECEVVDIPRPVILEMLDRPAIAKALALSTMVDEGTLREWLVNLGRRHAAGRIAHLMCELLDRLNAVGLVDDDSYQLPITQVELADTTGISGVHANRVLQRLRRQKLISLEGEELVVLDLAGLKRIAGWNPNYLHLQARATDDPIPFRII